MPTVTQEHKRGDSKVGTWGPEPFLRVTLIPYHNLHREEGSKPRSQQSGRVASVCVCVCVCVKVSLDVTCILV